MKLSQKKIHLLDSYVKNKLISKRTHESGQLHIYKYTQAVQYSKLWDEMTMMARGLILDDNHNILALPFPKFFNLEEYGPNPELPNEPYDIYEKMDGSLGILYWYRDRPYIATAGSFSSDQAIWATQYLYDKHRKVFPKLDRGLTYLFEIIYPENRIVVDYSGFSGLVLLGARNVDTGEDIYLENIPASNYFPTTNKFQYNGDMRDIKSKLGIPNLEGFVLRYKSGFRVKIKLDEYVRLHTILSEVSTTSVWEMLRNNDPLPESIPDEIFNWIKLTEKNLKMEFDTILSNVTSIYNRLDKTKSRKEIALEIKDIPFKGLIFSLLDNKDISDSIWKMIKPKYSRPINIEE